MRDWGGGGRVFEFVGRCEGRQSVRAPVLSLLLLARGCAACLADIICRWSPNDSTPELCADAFAAPPLHALLLLLTAASLGLLLYKSDKRWCEARDHRRHREGGVTCSRLGVAGSGTAASDCNTHGTHGAEQCLQEVARGGAGSPSAAAVSNEQKREILFALLASNQLVVGWARALYTPFLAWNFYALPLVLALAGVSKVRGFFALAPAIKAGEVLARTRGHVHRHASAPPHDTPHPCAGGNGLDFHRD